MTSVEVISGSARGTIRLPKLPQEITKDDIRTHCSMFIHDGFLMVCGGGTCAYDSHYGKKESWKCFQFKNGIWNKHSNLIRKRADSATVTTDKETFIFGGTQSMKTYEYLPTGSKKWKQGKPNRLSGGFLNGCAIEVKSKQEIWLIGGRRTRKNGGRGAYLDDMILGFDINSHTSRELPIKLIQKREYHACAFIPGTGKILVTGGLTGFPFEWESSCEIIDTGNGTVTMASPMNHKRCGHGMGVVNVNGEDRLAVFGGTQGGMNIHDSIELYNTKTQTWELSEDLELNIPRCTFGFLNI